MITLDHVTKQYKASARPALDNVSLNVDKGEFVFLIGPSGSGKSTFMRLLTAEDTPTSGEMQISKFHVNKLSGRQIPKLRQVIGCVFQDFRLLQQKTVFENVAFALEVIGKQNDLIKKVVPEVLDMVGLSGKANRMPGELSGGEQQRVAIARALVTKPKLLVWDEPTAHQDEQRVDVIVDLVQATLERDGTVIVAAHDPRLEERMNAEHVFSLDGGRLVTSAEEGATC